MLKAAHGDDWESVVDADFDFVREAVIEVYELQKEIGFSDYSLDGHTGFVFTSRMGSVFVPNVINKAIGRIIDAYNTAEIEKALKANRSAELLPHFSCHSLRHTICARLCEVEDNVKFIQEFMGHADITTTMDIYAEFSAEKKQEKVTTLSKKINME